MSWEIKVPATTANLGAGFDSIGVALELYLTLKVTLAEKWEFVPQSLNIEDLPTDRSNLIYKIAEKTARRFSDCSLPACRVEMTSKIPLARGLGSSATAIVAGIELANQLLKLNLSDNAKLDFAAEIEGHPDNVAPSILGGCVIGHYDQTVDQVRVTINDPIFLAIIPSFQLKTEDARHVLPQSFDYEKSVKASSVANVSVAAIFERNWSLLGKMMSKDNFHQPYRKRLVPHYDQVIAMLEKEVYGVYLSGAGPTMMALVDPLVVEQNLNKWKSIFPHFDWLALSVDNKGTQVIR